MKSKSDKRILWLDSLKGIACLIVFFAHVIARYPETVDYSYGVGKTGVWLFMVSSGYLLMVTAPKKLSWKWLLRYYINKLVKIYPGIIIGCLLLYKAAVITEKNEIFKALLLMSGPAHLWYVPVIMKFYLVAPLILLLDKKVDSKLSRFLGFSVLLILLSVIFPFYKYVQNSIELKWYMPVFLLGILLYYIPRKEWKYSFIWDIIISICVAVMVVLMPYFRVRWLHFGEPGFLYDKYLLLGGLWTIICFCMLQGCSSKKLLDKCKPLHWFSAFNYPFYIIHYPIIYILLSIYAFPQWAMFIVAFAVSIILSVIYYWVIDKGLGWLMGKVLKKE